MSNTNGRHSLLEELERAESVLDGLLRKISNVSEYLSPLEHMLRAEDFSSTGSYIPGVSNGIVCVLSAMIKGDPLANSIELIRGKGNNFPAIIKGSDRSETKSTCDSILKIVEGKPGGKPVTYVINLRWANLPSVIDGKSVLVVGNRSNYDQRGSLKKLYNKFKEEGESFKPKYIRLLSYGGSESPERVLNEVGVDIRSKKFWQGGFNIIKEMVDNLKRLR